jgi:hypothetical protein
VRVILPHHGITSGHLAIDDTDHPRSKAAKALAYLYKLREQDPSLTVDGTWKYM